MQNPGIFRGFLLAVPLIKADPDSDPDTAYRVGF
jgi:hypothetical protein